MELTYIVPTIMGLEAFAAREINRLGYETTVEDGRVTFSGDLNAMARVNINIRTGERVLIKVAEFTAMSFEELFQNTKKIKWSKFISRNGAFPVKGHCLRSQLASMRDCQAIIKKAVALSLTEDYGDEQLSESAETYQLQFSVRKDVVTLMIDTSGSGLHKRGYRLEANLAPLKETIAAGLVMISYWKYETPLIDPFCGSGTILIEAAMFKNNIAPGVNRSFLGESFYFSNEEIWENARAEAREKERKLPLKLYGYDIDPEALRIAKANALRAGVGDLIEFAQKDATELLVSEKSGSVICNPPYGERLSEKDECEKLYKKLGVAFSKYPYWSFYILTSHDGFEKIYGKRANKRRKLYNGMIKCNYYQYFGKRDF